MRRTRQFLIITAMALALPVLAFAKADLDYLTVDFFDETSGSFINGIIG